MTQSAADYQIETNLDSEHFHAKLSKRTISDDALADNGIRGNWNLCRVPRA